MHWQVYKVWKIQNPHHRVGVLAPNAKYKISVKPNGEMPFLYGNNVLNAHIDTMTQDTPDHAGVIITDKQGRPLGFGVSAKSSMERKTHRQMQLWPLDREMLVNIYVMKTRYLLISTRMNKNINE